MSDGYTTALRVLMMPKDTNHEGSIFGGVILSHIDQAGYVEARKHGINRWVTAAIDRVDFVAPVFKGDIVSYLARTVRLGTTSVTVDVRVEAERRLDGQNVHVTTAQLVLVSIDDECKPTPFANSGAPQ